MMELKETRNSSTSVEFNVEKASEKNNSDARRVYDALFSQEVEEDGKSVETIHAEKLKDKFIFSDVSTLDWLKTWRSIEIS